MSDILQRIIATKHREVEAHRQMGVRDRLERLAVNEPQRASFTSALRSRGVSIIAEFKRRSPSRGWIAEGADVRSVAQGYEGAGAMAMSVLTDRDYFGGALADLLAASEVCQLPLLRKDFIIDELQILEARACGASAILLIAAALTVEQARRLSAFAHQLGLEVLLEIHNEGELEHLACQPDAVGVNNRNLRTFVTDIDVSRQLSRHIPDEFVKVTESGLSTPEAIRELSACGYQAFLMGEAFMKTGAPAHALAQLLSAI